MPTRPFARRARVSTRRCVSDRYCGSNHLRRRDGSEEKNARGGSREKAAKCSRHSRRSPSRMSPARCHVRKAGKRWKGHLLFLVVPGVFQRTEEGSIKERAFSATEISSNNSLLATCELQKFKTQPSNLLNAEFAYAEK